MRTRSHLVAVLGPLFRCHLFFLVNHVLLSPPRSDAPQNLSASGIFCSVPKWQSDHLLTLERQNLLCASWTQRRVRGPRLWFLVLPWTLKEACARWASSPRLSRSGKGRNEVTEMLRMPLLTRSCFRSFSIFSDFVFVFSWAKNLLYQCFYVTRMNWICTL